MSRKGSNNGGFSANNCPPNSCTLPMCPCVCVTVHVCVCMCVCACLVLWQFTLNGMVKKVKKRESSEWGADFDSVCVTPSLAERQTIKVQTQCQWGRHFLLSFFCIIIRLTCFTGIISMDIIVMFAQAEEKGRRNDKSVVSVLFPFLLLAMWPVVRSFRSWDDNSKTDERLRQALTHTDSSECLSTSLCQIIVALSFN